MAESPFGEVQLIQGEVDEDGRGIFHRVDPGPYDDFIRMLLGKPEGTQAEVTVATGEFVTRGKASKGRGKSELSDARSFAAAASRVDKGLRLSWRHNTGDRAGTTTLRMMLAPKREFSDETVEKRTQALEARRLQNAQAKLAADPNNKELQGRVQTIKDRMNGAKKQPATTATEK
jgi:hypothetical protein